MPLLSTLHSTFGFKEFRPHQQEIIASILAGRDTFAVMPTGGGKSLCYQLPALLQDGVCLVISPLISLMKDQVDAALAVGIKAAFLNSSLPAQERGEVLRRFHQGELDLLYLAPERLSLFREQLRTAPISFVAVDEAHCISDWGHDFRPDYLTLAQLKEWLPNITLAAFTATATQQVQDDIINRLNLQQPFCLRASFNRPNLFYQVQRREGVLGQIERAIKAQGSEPGIVYRLSRADVEKTALYLAKQGIAALPYHAGLEAEERAANQEAFNRDQVQVIVATVAFGMGIDKSNVRFVIHGDLPKNLEGYYQETGRAGRDGEPAHCLLLYNRGDMMRLGNFIDQLASENEQRIGWQKLKQITSFAETAVCRRRQLLTYFEEEYPEDNCGACDVCQQGVEQVDATTEAQMLMSAIFRTDQRFGAAHVIDIVCGAKTKKIMQFHHDQVKTYGVGSGHPKPYWRRLCDAMLSQGLLAATGGKFPVLRLTAAGEEVLYGRQSFSYQQLLGTPTPAHPDPTASAHNPELFEKLRQLRRTLAERDDVPPFVVFSDRSLREMSSLFPGTSGELLAIHGVGQQKLQRYGQDFLAVIKQFVNDNPDLDTTSSCPTVAISSPLPLALTDTLIVTRDLARQGQNIAEIATNRELSPATIAGHLEKLFILGELTDISALISGDLLQVLTDAFGKQGDFRLKPVVESLDGLGGYNEAMVARGYLQARK